MPPPSFGNKLLLALALEVVCAFNAFAAPASDTAGREVGLVPVSVERDAVQWIERVRLASCARPFTGIFVLLSSTGTMASSRIWHACDAKQQLERVEALAGTPRTVFRRNDEVRTYLPQSRVVRTDPREASGIFPLVPVVAGASISRFYETRLL